MSMFANKVVDEKPICPMKGCHQPVEPGEGEAFFVAPESLIPLFDAGLVADISGVVIVHRGCAS